MSLRIDTDMIRRLTRSSAKFRELSDDTTVSSFVQTIFDVGHEYAIVLEKVLKYYSCLNNEFQTVDGPLLIRNIVADAKTDAMEHMRRASNVVPLVDVVLGREVPVSEMIGDGPVIKECVQELLFNGLRHDDNAHVTIQVSAEGRHPCRVKFTVENRGIPIQDEDMASIYTPFNNIHRGVVHGAGLGIGLALCKQLVLRAGGDMNAWNGPVTAFSLTFPLRHEKPVCLQQAGMNVMYRHEERGDRVESSDTDELNLFSSTVSSAKAERPSVLVVDDSAIARRMFEKMMNYVDVEVDLCDSALGCLKKVASKRYDVICLDIIMPVMSGITCADHIRHGTTINKDCPIVIITADSSTETRQLCACIPDSMVLEKPAKRNVLYRTIMSSLRAEPNKEWIRRRWLERRERREHRERASNV